MRTRTRRVAGVALAVLWVAGLQSTGAPPGENAYRVALPGYRYSFPRDFFAHPEFQTEWWYYTGNLRAADGRRLGFELTFFRQGVSRAAAKQVWEVRDLYLAHLALSDLDGGKFYHTERLNRAGPGIAGVDENARRIWNGNWQSEWHGQKQELQAIAEQFQLHLSLEPEKEPVIHGEDGVSQKAAGPGRASHYISLTRIAAGGELVLKGTTLEVRGLAWMDHEFFTHQLTPEQAGWDWLSVQLDDGTELMLFRIRRKDGSVDPYSAGTYVDRAGKSTHLREDDFLLEPGAGTWKSPDSGASYPLDWRVRVPKLALELEVETPLASQELGGSNARLAPTYWEGAISAKGQRNGPVRGVGYLEMTGYAGTLEWVP